MPLLIIEITLLALYFFMNSYLIDKSVYTLSNDRLSHLMEITESQTRITSEQLRTVSDLSLILQSEIIRFYNHPDQFSLQKQIPEFRFASNGVYYKPEDNGGCSLYYSALRPIEYKERKKALQSESLDPLLKGIYHANRNIVAVYLNTFDSMSRYYPFFKDVFKQLPPKMNIPDFNFYYLADEKHNPGRSNVWTEAYLDPMGKGWMMSCIVPIYRADFLEGVVGIDITITNFIENLIKLKLPWGTHAFLIDSKGTIMAMPPEVEKIFGLAELHKYTYKGKVQQDTHKPQIFNLLNSVLPHAAESISKLIQQTKGSAEIILNDDSYLLCQHTVPETGWKLIVIADKKTILSPVSKLEHQSKYVGYAAAGFMVLFYIAFFLYLLRNTRRMSGKIAETTGGLSNAIQRLGTGIYETKIKPSNVIEMDALSGQFKSMVNDLKTLHQNLEKEVENANQAKTAATQAEEQLREHRNHLENIVKDRTNELTEANKKLKEDIIKLEQVEIKLDSERRQLLSVFDSIDEPIYVCDPDTYEMLYANEAFKKYWPDPVGKKCYKVLQNLDLPCSFCTNDIIFGEKFGEPHIWKFKNKVADRWFRCIDKAIQWPDGRMVRCEMAIDITDQEEAHAEKQKLMERLKRSEKMEALGTLAGGVAHDLNNILGGIVGYPEMILMDMPYDNPLRASILAIQESGLRAAAVVQDLLTLARRGVAVMELTNINDIINAYLSSPENELLYQNNLITLKTNLSENLLNCTGSPIHLSKMIMNLVYNAAEAMPNGGEIIISTHNQYVDKPLKGYDEVMEGDYVVLKVMDSGIGISSEDLERIFEPFYTKKKMGRSGSGLGMAVVWGTVKDHKGYIEVKSTIGKGATFEIYLPATREVIENRKMDYNICEFRGNNESILVIDDVKIQREIAVDILTKLGYDASSVSSGEGAVAYLEHNKVDLVILDMIMEPNIDGLETYKRILKIHPRQKAIIVSGYTDTVVIREVQKLGAGKYVKKPYTANEIGRAVKEELNK
ncbi:MAG: response regulator [Proteobacteria bacterium]|nr:response regulator [Pseudomonadota bacterium]